MAIYQLKTFLDIVDSVREELKIQSSDTNSINRIKRDINIAYLDEVLPHHNWPWARDQHEGQVETRYTTGTANVTQNSKSITLSTTPSPNYKGYKFTVDGYDEIYEINTHSGTAITLKTPYNGTSNTTASIKIFKNALALPVTCRETIEVWCGNSRTPLRALGLQEFRRMQSTAPKAEGFPRYYCTTDFKDPDEYSTISGLPASASRSSSLYVRTIVFASDVSSYLKVGDRISVTNAGQQRYNGEYVISSVSTTTVTYTGFDSYTESSAADTSITVEKKNVEGSDEAFRELLYHPSISDKFSTLYIDYIVNPKPLEDDADQPIIPITNRIVLLYGALARAWTRERNPEEAQRNYVLFQNQLKRMAGNLEDSHDKLLLSPSKTYLSVKRNSGKKARSYDIYDSVGGGGSSAGGVKGTADMVAVYDSEGVLSQSSLTSTTELDYLDGVTNNVQTQLDTKVTGPSSATDNAVARFDSSSGKIVQNSSVVISDANAISGGTSLAVDNITIDGNTISSTDTNGNVNVSPNGTGTVIINTDLDVDNLNLNGNAIISTDSNGDVDITPDGTGRANISNPTMVGTTASHVIVNDGSGDITSEAQLANTRGGTAQDSSSSTGLAKVSTGTWSFAALADADVGASAAIARSKLGTGTANYVVINAADGTFSGEATLAASRGGTNLDTSGSTGVAKVSSGTWSVATVVDADVDASAAITKTKLATGTADRVEITDGSGNITESTITSTELTYLNDFVPLTAVSLADNTGSVTNVFTYTAADFEFAIVEYSIARGGGNREVGQLMVATDGSTVNMTQTTSELGTIGVTLSADIDSGNVRIRYTSTSTGTAPSFKYIIRRWDS